MGLDVIWIFIEAYKPFGQYVQQLSHTDKDEVGMTIPLALARMEWVLPGPLGKGKSSSDIAQTQPILYIYSKIKSNRPNHKSDFSLSLSLS